MTRRTATLAKEPLVITNAGAHRGAWNNLPAFLNWNAQSSRYALVPRFVDPVPGRAQSLAAEARTRGLLAEAVEATIEEVVSESQGLQTPLLLNLDRPEAMATALDLTADAPPPTLGYLLIKLPLGELWGLRFALRPNDIELRRDLGLFLKRLGALVAPQGSSAIVGEDADPAHLAAERQYRSWMARHAQENLLRLVARLPSASYPIELTDDGLTTMFAIVREGDTWADPRVLAADVVQRPPRPVVRGGDFCIVEITPAGIRFHKVRLRESDGRLAVGGHSDFDEAALATAAARAEAERKAAEAARIALQRAERQAVTMTSPAWTTD